MSLEKTLVGDHIWDLLIKSNDLDLRLHKEACEIINLRKRNIDNFDEKLENFVERCKKLQLRSS